MSTAQNFGECFRENRKALGITLREFCRRNGFDPGNVSRIERSIVPPPQSVQLLESYAKALKLESGTVAWERFVALAATEAGRIPADVLENQQASAKLPGLFESVRGKGHRRWVSALDLERWADTEAARNTLPELVRRLVRATGKDIKAMEFPAHEQVQRPGWDGIVEAGEADAYVPAGISGWEMGVTKNAETKAKEEFDKRMKDPCGLARENTTFVFVTLRKWQKKAAWRQAKEALGVWKAVRVYDSASLEEWLEQAPAVDAWLARLVGNKPIGVVSIDEYWANLQAVTDPSLAPGVFLASREEQMKQLERWLAGPPGAMLVEARSPVDAIDFVAAFSRDPERGKCFENALVIETREAWRDVSAAAGAGLLLIAHPSLTIEPELVAKWCARDIACWFRQTRRRESRWSAFSCSGLSAKTWKSRFVSQGSKTRKRAGSPRESGGSLTVLKRLLGRYPGTTEPEWSRPAEAPALVPTLLAGSWDETSEGDRSAIERMSAQPYSAAAATAARWLKGADSPLTRNGSRWGLVSRDDSWFFLAKVLTPNDLERFEAVALDVLSDDDTALELSADERWQARLQRKMPTYSSALRNGIAETLALLAARPEGLPQAHDIVGRVEHLVRQLLSGKGRLRWLSISDQLPLLAEAGPDAFLTAVERALRRESPELLTLFEQVGLMGWPSLQHARLLSALEGLAWNRAVLAAGEPNPRGAGRTVAQRQDGEQPIAEPDGDIHAVAPADNRPRRGANQSTDKGHSQSAGGRLAAAFRPAAQSAAFLYGHPSPSVAGLGAGPVCHDTDGRLLETGPCLREFAHRARWR